MSDIIHILPDSIANQIAAGEVIQRPSSIIKELMENSLDAGASSISVVVKNAGKTLVQVTDNGKGMSHTDARMSFERHATSKISHANDLFALSTMGFRGEALASIASIAVVELRTKQKNADLGTCIEISSSSVIRHEPMAGIAEGTTFLVKNLFFNVPARRKFLKSEETELRHIIYEFQRIALANPNIEFSLYNDRELLYEAHGGNLKQRIIAIFGKKQKNLSNQLISIGAETNIVKISGFIGNPQSSSRNATQFFFVNGRYMRHPYFYKAILMAYAGMLQPDTQPLYFINFEVKPENIDVNVHPTKTEIKFEDEKEIFSILMACVRESLGKFNFAPSLDFDITDKINIPTYSNKKFPSMPKPNININYNPFVNHNTNNYINSTATKWDMLYEQNSAKNINESDRPMKSNTLFDDSTHAVSFFIYKDKYLITGVKSGLMIIDQQRAIERIAYDKILLQLEHGQKATQSLLFPDTIELTPDEAIIFKEIYSELKDFGFDFEMITETKYQITGSPMILSDLVNLEKLLKDIINYVADTSVVGKEIYEKIAIQTVKSYSNNSIKPLNQQEVETLIASLFQCAMPNISPDGFKIVVILSDKDIWE